jgi:hypothetical protein
MVIGIARATTIMGGFMRTHTKTIALTFLSLLTLHCSSQAGEGELGQNSAAVSVDNDQHATYGITVFGKNGDEQPLACGGHSESESFYAASSQRYGCGVHLKIVAKNGKCAVVSTQDVGPAAWVEDNAGMPILDVDPAVSEHFWGISSIGWSMLASSGDTYTVTSSVTSLPVGPCADEAGGGSATPDPAPSGDPPPAPTKPSNPGGGGSDDTGGSEDGSEDSSDSEE